MLLNLIDLSKWSIMFAVLYSCALKIYSILPQLIITQGTQSMHKYQHVNIIKNTYFVLERFGSLVFLFSLSCRCNWKYATLVISLLKLYIAILEQLSFIAKQCSNIWCLWILDAFFCDIFLSRNVKRIFHNYNFQY